MAKILVVEDNEMNREIVARQLVRAGYEVVLAVDGLEGIEMAESERPDLILMDMGLPRLNGFRATRQIRKTPSIHQIPIIALTAFAMEGEREKCLAVGCDDYDTKPVDFDRLLGKITAQLDGRPLP
jgi:CheY-like chemotaxis protein